MKKFRVNWKLEGSYTVTAQDLGMEEDEDQSLEKAIEILEEEPFAAFDPVEDGKETIEVIEV